MRQVGRVGRVASHRWSVQNRRAVWTRVDAMRQAAGDALRENTRAILQCPSDANLAQIWARDASGRTRRSGCVAPLERAKPARRSDRTRSDARERDASGRWRCPEWAAVHFFDPFNRISVLKKRISQPVLL
jgi:hypothetical protein